MVPEMLNNSPAARIVSILAAAKLGLAHHNRQNASMERFVIRPDHEGFSVIDIWTGEPAVIAMTPQTGMPQEDADHTAGLLNRRAAGDERTVLQ